MTDTDVVIRKLDEHVVPGKRLGRHVEHDPRSRNYAYEDAVIQFRSVIHRRYGPVLDQGQLGSCTGNAAAGAINTVPIHKTGEVELNEQDAVDLYELATHIDRFEGTYPPDDTGSSGLAVAHAAKNKGYITGYHHAFSLDNALSALQKYPVITGVAWYEGFDEPDPNTGIVEISGDIRGGHEFEVLGFELKDTIMDSLVVCENSWGDGWGLGGRFKFTVSTWEQLLADYGDVTILHNFVTS